MLIKHSPDLRPSEITPREVYLNRRNLLAGAAGLLGAGALGLR
jgi:sulfoxide reductase catalytic subunit YedY